MALRDKLRERAQAHLEPGEQIRHVFLAQAGPNPYLQFLTYLIFFWVKSRVAVVTDRSLVLLRSSVWTPAKPKGVADRLPLPRHLGEARGLWATLDLAGTKYYVHKRFHKDLVAANADLAARPVGAPPAMPVFPPPGPVA